MADDITPEITGRCYCGATRLHATETPLSVLYCHCTDCRRASGGPVAAFAAFREGTIVFSPNEGRAISRVPGVIRTFCETCGSPLTGRYDYLPNTVYVPLGLLDQADRFPPQMHAHDDNRLQWLHINDDLPRHTSSARSQLNE